MVQALVDSSSATTAAHLNPAEQEAPVMLPIPHSKRAASKRCKPSDEITFSAPSPRKRAKPAAGRLKKTYTPSKALVERANAGFPDVEAEEDGEFQAALVSAGTRNRSPVMPATTGYGSYPEKPSDNDPVSDFEVVMHSDIDGNTDDSGADNDHDTVDPYSEGDANGEEVRPGAGSLSGSRAGVQVDSPCDSLYHADTSFNGVRGAIYGRSGICTTQRSYQSRLRSRDNTSLHSASSTAASQAHSRARVLLLDQLSDDDNDDSIDQDAEIQEVRAQVAQFEKDQAAASKKKASAHTKKPVAAKRQGKSWALELIADWLNAHLLMCSVEEAGNCPWQAIDNCGRTILSAT